VPVLLALVAALCYGTGDFLGGQAARRAPALSASFVLLATGLVLLVPWTLATADGPPSAAVLGFGIVAGVTGSLSALTLYPALALGNASEVAPLSAVIGTAGPVLFGLATGERPGPSAWAGMALAALTIVLVSADGRASALEPVRRRRSLLLAATSGVFIAAFLIAYERAGSDQGLLPLFVARATGVALFGAVLALRHERPWPARVSPAPAILGGVFDLAANASFLFALARAPLSLVVPLANLYPAFTVLLGVVVLRERPRPVQQLGLGMALVAIFLITR
jgi:drug/metabolite transporter (DMT)-like permease